MSTPTRYSYTRTPRVALGWGALTLGALLLPLTNIALLRRGYSLPGQSIAKNARALAFSAGIFVGPWLTAHELAEDRLVLRQGLNFRGEIPYGNIASVQATERTSTGFPLRLYPHTLFLALWPINLVAIRLRRPQRFRLFHLLPVWKVREVIVNVDRRGAFIAELRARAAAAETYGEDESS
jgi:hypothetical protein